MTGSCNETTLPLGPLPYADGALHVLSRALARAAFGPDGVARRTLDDGRISLAYGGMGTRGTLNGGSARPSVGTLGGGVPAWGRSDGRPWTQEDVGIGFLVYA